MAWAGAVIVLAAAVLSACAGRPVAPGDDPLSTRSVWTAADSMSAHAAATRFLAAFDSLRWDRFRAFLSDDITMFFPFPDLPARVDGRTAVEEAFSGFFRARADEGATSLGISPRALRLQMASADAAVVSFELGTSPSRRSIVLARTARDDWKVVHWHASPAPAPPRSQPAPPMSPAPRLP